MELAAAPNGKTGRQEDMFLPQKNTGDGRSKDGSTKSQKFGCFICRGKHVQRLCPQLSWASRLYDVGSVGIIEISHANAPDHDAKGGKEKAA